MTITLLEILDSAVKIGLGAGIAAYATYKSNKLNHANDRNKDIRAHKIKTIEWTAERCDAYFVAYSKLHNRLEGMRRKHNPTCELSFDDAQLNYVKECDKELLAAFDGASSARSRLRLLQASEAERILGEIGSSIAGYRNKVIFDKVLPAEDFAKKHGEDFIALRRRFDEELSKFYSRA